jgi:hypothetical protein
MLAPEALRTAGGEERGALGVAGSAFNTLKEQRMEGHSSLRQGTEGAKQAKIQTRSPGMRLGKCSSRMVNLPPVPQPSLQFTASRPGAWSVSPNRSPACDSELNPWVFLVLINSMTLGTMGLGWAPGNTYCYPSQCSLFSSTAQKTRQTVLIWYFKAI